MAFLSSRVARARLTASAAATQRVRELRAAGVDIAALTEGGVLTSDGNVTDYLLSQGISVPNGQGYGLSPYFRVSFASAMDNLEEACRRIEAAARRIM